MKHLLVWVAVLSLTCFACNSPQPRLNAPPHGTAEDTSEMHSMYEHMIDNALLEEMTVSDMHFLPHRSILNTLGQQRLSRLTSLMEAYGGEIRFSTSLEDEQLIDQRLDVVLEFLREAGLDTSAEILRPDLPGGSGMDATEAILIKLNEATYKPGKSSDAGSTLLTETK